MQKNQCGNSSKKMGSKRIFTICLYINRKWGKRYAQQNLPITEKIADTMLRLPLHMHLTDEDVEYVISSLNNSLKEYYE